MIIIIYNCFKSLRMGKRGREPFIELLNKSTGEKIPVMYWENSIGRSKSSDIFLEGMTVSRDHAVLFRREEGWIISDTNSKWGVLVNGDKIEGSKRVSIDDTINIGGIELVVKRVRDKNTNSGKKRKKEEITFDTVPQGLLLFWVTVFHFLASFTACFHSEELNLNPAIAFGTVTGIGWLCFLVTKYGFRRVNFELESLGILLSGIGIITISAADIKETYMQMIAMGCGIVLFLVILFFVKNPESAMKFRPYVAGFALLLFVVNIIFGKIKNGSQNWISVGGLSLQPSELVKVAFVFVGASTLERLQTAKNLTGFILFSGACMMALFLMGDFGTACVFFVTFLIISFMRSGSIRTVILICTAAVMGGVLILKFKPYIVSRFSVWRHVWEHVNDLGYQQTRVLTYSASGGLFGVGIGRGCLKYVFASGTDLIFGMLCEEWGLILAVCSVMCVIFMGFYARSASTRSRSEFYSIASCAAAGMMAFQMSLNVFGATDILPLTGVTLPFISMGGSSMVCVWGLLAFIKASDERTYALKR